MKSMSELLSYTYDFISLLFEYEEARKNIRKIILFGSVASGNYDEKSDIDLFIDTRSEEVEQKVEEAKKRFGSRIDEKWSLKGIKNPVSCIVGDLDDDHWSDLREDIISNGITIYGKYKELPEKMDHYALFTYSLSDLSQKRKMKLVRDFFGYKTEKKGKTYRKEGLIDKKEGEKIAQNALVVPVEESKAIKEKFSEFGVTPKIREVWFRQA